MYSDKLTQSIAKAANQVMDEQLKGDQHKIDKNKNGKVDAHDFKLLRKEKGLEEGKMGQLSADLTDLSHADFHKEYGKPKSHFDPTNFKKPVQPGKEMDRAKALAQRGMASMKKEEVEDLSEASYVVKHDGVSDDAKDSDAKKLFAGKTNINSHMTKYASSAEKHADMLKSKGFKNVRIQTMNKEEVEELEEMFPGTPEYEKKYGKTPQDMKKGEKKKTSQGEMEKTEKGVVHKRKFSEMLEVYGDNGIKGLFEALQDKEELIEEPTNAEFTAELEKAKNKAAGKDKADVAAAAVKGTKEMDEEVELEERELTDAEMKEREKNVKGMKKGVEGFKERYGKDAKSVMYATATKMAKEK
jgi:hypothetical protein